MILTKKLSRLVMKRAVTSYCESNFFFVMCFVFVEIVFVYSCIFCMWLHLECQLVDTLINSGASVLIAVLDLLRGFN